MIYKAKLFHKKWMILVCVFAQLWTWSNWETLASWSCFYSFWDFGYVCTLTSPCEVDETSVEQSDAKSFWLFLQELDYVVKAKFIEENPEAL